MTTTIDRRVPKRFRQHSIRAFTPAPARIRLASNIEVKSDYLGQHDKYSTRDAADSIALANNFGAWRSLSSTDGYWFSLELPTGVGGGGYSLATFKSILQANKALGLTNMWTVYGTPKNHVVGPKSQQWKPNTSYAVTPGGNSGAGPSWPTMETNYKDHVYPTPANRVARRYWVSTAGTTGATEPNWASATTAGATVSSGSAVFTCKGDAADSFHVNFFGFGYAEPADSTALYNYVNAVLADFNTTEKLIDYIEVRNEPNFYKQVGAASITDFFMGDAEDLVRECAVVVDCVKNFSGFKPLVGGCGFTNFNSFLGSQGIDDSSHVLRQFLAAYDTESGLHGKDLKFDYYSFHAYQTGIRYVSTTEQKNHFYFGSRRSGIREALNENGLAHIPLINSESGIMSLESNIPPGNDAYLFTTLTPAERKTIFEMRNLIALAAGVRNTYMYSMNHTNNGYGTTLAVNYANDSGGLNTNSIKTWKYIEYIDMEMTTGTLYAKINGGGEQTWVFPAAATALGIK